MEFYIFIFLADPSVTTPGPGVITTTSGTSGASGTPCPTNPCLNGAACYLIAGGGFICNCAQGYAGLLCDAISNLPEEITLKYRSYWFFFLIII
jgi:hypothetical protein